MFTPITRRLVPLTVAFALSALAGVAISPGPSTGAEEAVTPGSSVCTEALEPPTTPVAPHPSTHGERTYY